jgi:hypothetical protein
MSLAWTVSWPGAFRERPPRWLVGAGISTGLVVNGGQDHRRTFLLMDETQSEPSLVTEDRLLDVLRELARREPLFHRRELVNSRADFERETADDFWETGASGRRYSREYVWAILKERYESSDQDEYEVERWETRDFQLREVAPKP